MSKKTSDFISEWRAAETREAERAALRALLDAGRRGS